MNFWEKEDGPNIHWLDCIFMLACTIFTSQNSCEPILFLQSHCVHWSHKNLISDSSTTSLIFIEIVLNNGKQCFMFLFYYRKTSKCHPYGAANDTNFSSHSLEEM